MPFDESKTCFNCFWAWLKEGEIRCTRLPPSPLAQDAQAPDIAKFNKTTYVRCPGIPGCGEWQEIPQVEVDESMEM